MDYKEKHDKIISDSLLRGLDKSKCEGYFELHHIIPRCFNGDNSKENLVLLTAKEHLTIHYLLCLIHENSKESNSKEKYLKSLRSFHAMLYLFDIKSQGRIFDDIAEEWSYYRIKYNEVNHGKNNPMFGKKLSKEHINRISTALKGVKTWNTGKNMNDNPELSVLSHPCCWEGKKLPEDMVKNIKASRIKFESENNWAWINNGVIDKKLFNGEEIPKNFIMGRKQISEEHRINLMISLKGREVWNSGKKTNTIPYNKKHRFIKIKKVIRIKLKDPIPVYDVTVPKTNNFLLGNKVVVHNCMGSAVAYHFGYNSLHVIGATRPDTCMSKDMVKMASMFGAKFCFLKIGYNPVLQSKVDKIISENPNRYFKLNYGITIDEKSEKSKIVEFHFIGANQVKNIPDDIENLIIPSGSCNSAISILYGLSKFKPKNLKNIYLIGIGPKKLKFINDRLHLIKTESGVNTLNFNLGFETEELQSYPDLNPYNIKYIDIHSIPKYDYQNEVKFSYNGINFHPTYEGKVMDYITKNHPDLISDKTMLWIVGSKPSIECMLPNLKGFKIPVNPSIYSNDWK